MKKILSLFCALVATAAMAQTTGTAKATINGQEVEIGWVQLWKDGPRFATRNVGATGASDKESTLGTAMTFTEAAKTGTDYVWGVNWKTPSNDLQYLLDTDKVTCSYEQQDDVWGFKFTGKGDYSSNSIFLPAADDENTGSDYGYSYYWSTATIRNDEPYYLYLYYEEDEFYNKWKVGGKSEEDFVRPVLAIEPSTPVTLNETDEDYSYPFIEPTLYDITINRTMTAGRWNTLMLPFDMTNEEIKSNFGESAQVMKMTDIKNNVVSFESATTIEYDIPYIVKPATDITKIVVKDKDVSEKIPTLEYYIMDDNNTIQYIIQCYCYQMTFNKGDNPMYVLSNNNFYQLDSEVTVKGFRWTITDNSGTNARALTLSLDGQTTGIEEIQNAKCKIQNSGKFIEDGRMVIVNNNKKFNVNGQEVK